MRKRAFTLLELMVAITLLLITGSALGWKFYGAVQEKKFQSELDRVLDRFQTCQRLAVASQSDWKGEIKKEETHWTFETICEENLKLKQLPPIRFHAAEFVFNGKEVEELQVDFFATGHVLPSGTFLFSQKKNNPSSSKREWQIPEIFQKEEGN